MRRGLVAVALLLVAGCGGGLADSDTDVLAKTDPPSHPETEPDPVVGPAMEPGLRVAHDARTARELWDALEVDELAPASDPAERSRHGALDAVDFDEQVVVLWRGGESGTCPERVDDAATAADGTVEVRLSQGLFDVVCTDDYQPYAVLAAVDRTQMPALPARGRAVGPGEDDTEFAVVDAGEPDAVAGAPAVAMAALPPPQRRGRETLAAHPAWTVREAGVLARPGDAFKVADGVSEVELVPTDRRGQPVGEPRPLAADTGELPDAEAATYRLTGQLDEQPVHEWIRVPAIERSASLRISARDADGEGGHVGAARAGEPLEVRVVNHGTVALGYRIEVAWQPWEFEEASPAPARDFVEEGLVEPAPSQEPAADKGSAADGSSGQHAEDTDPATPADDRPTGEGAVRRVEPGGESEPIPISAPDEPGAYQLVVGAGDALLTGGDGHMIRATLEHPFEVD